jgi:hypothetical protein
LYGSPTHWGEVWDKDAFIPEEDLDDPSGHGIDNDAASVTSDMSGSDGSFLDEENSLKIQFHNGNTAEAMDKRKFGLDGHQEDYWTTSEDLWWQMDVDDGFEDDSTNGVVEGAEEKLQEVAFEKEESLRENFESRIENKIVEIQDIVPWESISSVSFF